MSSPSLHQHLHPHVDVFILTSTSSPSHQRLRPHTNLLSLTLTSSASRQCPQIRVMSTPSHQHPHLCANIFTLVSTPTPSHRFLHLCVDVFALLSMSSTPCQHPQPHVNIINPTLMSSHVDVLLFVATSLSLC
ncbi:hypothetical protein BDN72DRAFT_905177 [Pluteus cervinus]|uniref:Uncharacterized protein n=1 Tax=Pluteus cervinus TaxID=181527 RepID=A0ACD3A3G9_9AGAR|nr:hypothetical protein BDN72DRAFT_905177 [Pluteus cervinus]